MKKSANVPAKWVIAVAASLLATGCASSSTRRYCVSKSGEIRPNAECTANGGAKGQDPYWQNRTTTHSGGFVPFFWGGSRPVSTAPGAPTPTAKSAPATPGTSSPARGGFGGSSSGSFGG